MPSKFQSTLPVWGATAERGLAVLPGCDFNPRSPCGERRNTILHGLTSTLFQSTLPVWGATEIVGSLFCCQIISIHAPRVGSDCEAAGLLQKETVISIHAPRVGSDASDLLLGLCGDNFNPRSPCGERPINRATGQCLIDISIHAPRVGSDRVVLCLFLIIKISIHAPRVGSDPPEPHKDNPWR